jgi:O-antigen/teichoic acid export membrane protein
VSLVLSVLLQLMDAPRLLGVVVVGVPFVAASVFGVIWLRIAIRDGSFRRALPDYGWAFLTLLLIAAACAAITAAGYLIAGEPLQPTTLSGGAALGVFVVLSLWWLLRGRRA